MVEFTMPSLGADMEEGTLLEWLVHPGDAVHRGQIIAVVDTTKAAVEVESFHDGVVGRLLVEPGTCVAVGTPLATIEPLAAGPAGPPTEPPVVRPEARPEAPPGEAPASPLVRRYARERSVDLHAVHGTGTGGRVTHADVALVAEAAPAAVPVQVVPEAVPAGAREAGTQAGRRLRVSPLARRLAAELGVDLSRVRPTGPGGAVGVEDVRRAAGPEAAAPAAAPVAPAPVPEPTAQGAQAAAALAAAERAAAMRATIAALMARSKREIPHYYLTETIDLGTATDWLAARNRAVPVPQRLVPAAVLLKAAALAARRVPELNGFWVDDAFVAAPDVHLGVAVALRGGGLVAPAIHDADTLGLADLMAALRDLVARVRAGRLRRAELSDPTITISNLGDQGVEAIHGVIYPPQVALVGFGRVTPRPWAVGGLIGVRPTVVATLAGDHRATDGATGARYLHILAELLQKPGEL